MRFPWEIDDDDFLGEPVRISGFARTVFKDGKRFDSLLEVEKAEDIVFRRSKTALRVLLVASILLVAVLACISAGLLVLWLRVRRERREAEVVAAERRRMAADLHDTIEQHLAGANLIAAGVLAIEDVPEDVKSAMKTMTGILANAKAEVRSAVLNLRGDGGASQSLEESISGMVAALQKAGVKARKMLRGVPASMSEGMLADIVLIMREAVTNAVKHGKAGTVVFTADPIPEGGFSIMVLNDGAPFDIDRTLGPETGHYGLSGMKERALRNHLSLSWGRDGRWTYARIATGGDNS